MTNQRPAILCLDALKGSASQVVCARRDKKVTVGSTEARTGFPFPTRTGFSLPVLKVAEGSDEARRRLSGGTRAVSAARGMSAWEYVNQRSVLLGFSQSEASVDNRQTELLLEPKSNCHC